MLEDKYFDDSLERGDPDLWDQLIRANWGQWMALACKELRAGDYSFEKGDAKGVVMLALFEFRKNLNLGQDGRGNEIPILTEVAYLDIGGRIKNKVQTVARRVRGEDAGKIGQRVKKEKTRREEENLELAKSGNKPMESMKDLGSKMESMQAEGFDEPENKGVRRADAASSKKELLSRVMALAGENCEEKFREYFDAQSELNQMKTDGELGKKITDDLTFKHIAKSRTVSWMAIHRGFYNCLDKMSAAAKKTRVDKNGTRFLYDDLREEFG